MPFQYTRTVQDFTEKITYLPLYYPVSSTWSSYLHRLVSLSGVLECPIHQGCPFHGIRYASDKECEK